VETAPTTKHGHSEPAESDLTTALMQAYLSGNGAEVERVMALMARSQQEQSARASAA
jgi:hypothetical protein